MSVMHKRVECVSKIVITLTEGSSVPVIAASNWTPTDSLAQVSVEIHTSILERVYELCKNAMYYTHFLL